MRSRDFTLNFYANPVGTAGLGNHKHNDLLSFTRASGYASVCRSGSFEYSRR
ncbi:MAG: hypothetical protein IPH59_10560 [bacterium]|nr:hypothetical protein [bacterium]